MGTVFTVGEGRLVNLAQEALRLWLT